MSMIHSRILKEIKHIKGQQIADNQSVISHCRSSVSYQFNQAKFRRPTEVKDKLNRNPFHLESVLKAKSKHKQCNNKYGLRKASRENSVSSFLENKPIELTLKKKSDQRLQQNIKKFVQNVRVIHNHLKQLAESMLGAFEKIKQEMENNLLKVADQMLKLNGQMTKVQKIHQIIHNGFEAFRKVAVLPLQSMSELKGLSQGSIGLQKQKQEKGRNTSRQPPLTPMMKPNKDQRKRTDMIYSSAFSSQQISPKGNFKLEKLNFNSISKSKARAQTSRKKGEKSEVNQPEQITTKRKVDEGKDLLTRRSAQSMDNIDSIISQMREILNQ